MSKFWRSWVFGHCLPPLSPLFSATHRVQATHRPLRVPSSAFAVRPLMRRGLAIAEENENDFINLLAACREIAEFPFYRLAICNSKIRIISRSKF